MAESDEPMTQLRHTPGPWQSRSLFRMIRAARTVAGLFFESRPEDDWADACLMAASPGLLAALKGMRAIAVPGMDWTDEIGQQLLADADSAIRKATTPNPTPTEDA